MNSSMSVRVAASFLLIGLSVAHAQGRMDQSLASLDAQARVEGESFAVRARALNERIARGWPAGTVQALMGDPERVQRSVEGPDEIEVWGYAGFEVRVQFRNGFVESWFVRFAQ
jgi:hypothetical protein